MRVVVHVESSHKRGMGHLFRGLHLAGALRAKGDEVIFVMNDDPRSIEIIRSERFDLEVVPIEINYPCSHIGPQGLQCCSEEAVLGKYRPDWWINDRLDTSPEHAKKIIEAGVRLATFDDHGEGGRLAAFNVLAMDLLPSERILNGLYGPEYIILNPGIEKYRLGPSREPKSQKILVTLGGSDTYGVTPRILSTLVQILPSSGIIASCGPNFNHIDELDSLMDRSHQPIELHFSPPDLIGLMAGAEIVICGGGVTLFEAAALGVPALGVANEPHEIPILEWFEKKGFCISLGFWKDKVEDRLCSLLPELLSDHGRLDRMSRMGRTLVDGKGLERIVAIIGSGRHE